MLKHIKEEGFATLTTASATRTYISHLPTLLHWDEQEAPYLSIHIANSNEHAKNLRGVPSLFSFQIANGYISPQTYQQKKINGKVVPTWNYAIAQAHVLPQKMSDAELYRHLQGLSAHNEQQTQEPWAITDAPEKYIQALMKAISGFRCRIDKLEGIWKLSQNKDPVTLSNIDQLLQQGSAKDKRLAELMASTGEADASA